MGKKGSITVFLALVLSILLSLVSASIQSVQAAAARTQILNSVDIGLYSLFGQYDRSLLKNYDLFFLDGTQGGTELNLATVYDNLESYMKPVLKQNSQNLRIKQGGFTGYRLATDQNGEVFYHQAVSYMKDTLGSQGVQVFLSRMRDQQNKTERAEADGKTAENGETLKNYDSEMSSAFDKSQEAEVEAKKDAANGGADFGSGDGGFSDGESESAINPIPVIKRIRTMSILDLVVPTSKGISDAQISVSDLVSKRRLEEGMTMPGNPQEDNSESSKLLFQKYLTDKLGNYQKPASSGLKYQQEYLLGANDNDRANLRLVANRLLLIREGVNAAALMSDAGKRAQMHALALAIASGFLVPPAAVIVEAALLLCWSFAESILDVRELFHGGKVPFIKNASNWQMSLESLPHLLENLDSQRRNDEKGMSYEDYLQVLLLTQSKRENLERGMDMIEVCIRSTNGRDSFRLDCCIEAIETSVDVDANRNKVFTVTRQYSYI